VVRSVTLRKQVVHLLKDFSMALRSREYEADREAWARALAIIYRVSATL